MYATPRFLPTSLAAVTFAIGMVACTFTPPPSVVQARNTATPAPSQTLTDYKGRIAQRIFERNPSLVLKAMLRSFVLVSFTVDKTGRLMQSSVYRTNGDDEAEATALASLRRALPLPAPPRLLNGASQLELFRRLDVQRQRPVPVANLAFATGDQHRLIAARTTRSL
ncbi:hypothetical protein BUMB_04507c [Candidatus Paraburkholderia calva]|nr:hypothetical protein BUMB_04507c [Candidatus Paraburkholderia calva]